MNTGLPTLRVSLRDRLKSIGDGGVYAYGRLLRTNPGLMAGSIDTNISDLMCLPEGRLIDALGSRYSHYIDQDGRELAYTTQHAQSVDEPDEAITEDGGMPFHKAYAIGQKWARVARIDPQLREYFYAPVRNDHAGVNEVDDSCRDWGVPVVPLQGVFTVGGVSFLPERKTSRVGRPSWGVRVLGSGVEINPALGGWDDVQKCNQKKMIEDIAHSYLLRMQHGQEDTNQNRWRTDFGLSPIEVDAEKGAFQRNGLRERA